MPSLLSRVARERTAALLGGTLTVTLAALSSHCSGHDTTEAAAMASAAHEFGWIHPIATYNFGEAVSRPLGHASMPLEGQTLRSIVTDANVKIRGDNRPCADCHAWASTMSRAAFCNEHVEAFLAQPTSTGASADPPSAKPELLKELLADWKKRGCPD